MKDKLPARRTLLFTLALALFVAVPASAAVGDEPDKPFAKNVIIMIGDGMGFNHVLATDYYLDGKGLTQGYERFPFRFAVSTYPDGGSYDPATAWTDFGYVETGWTESDAAATAVATGQKTDAGIGVDSLDDPQTNILELAEAKGKATGVVTSVELSHATPAAFVAHNPSRSDYEGIAQEMFLDSAVDVIMGAGHPWYGNDGVFTATPNTFRYVGGETTWDALVAGTAGGDADGDGTVDPWVLIQTRAEFQALAEGPTPSRVAGVAQSFETLQFYRDLASIAAPPYVVPFVQTVPTLQEMTRAALNVLDDDPEGFVVMIEGGAIDWAAHAHTYAKGRLIEETADFNRAFDAVTDWVKANSNWGETVVLVTADHETGYLWGPGSDPAWMPVVDNGAGVLPGLSYYAASVSDPRYPFPLVAHTNSLVPLYAKGDAARVLVGTIDGTDPVRGPYIDNTDIFTVMARAIGN